MSGNSWKNQNIHFNWVHLSYLYIPLQSGEYDGSICLGLLTSPFGYVGNGGRTLSRFCTKYGKGQAPKWKQGGYFQKKMEQIGGFSLLVNIIQPAICRFWRTEVYFVEIIIQYLCLPVCHSRTPSDQEKKFHEIYSNSLGCSVRIPISHSVQFFKKEALKDMERIKKQIRGI